MLSLSLTFGLALSRGMLSYFIIEQLVPLSSELLGRHLDDPFLGHFLAILYHNKTDPEYLSIQLQLLLDYVLDGDGDLALGGIDFIGVVGFLELADVAQELVLYQDEESPVEDQAQVGLFLGDGDVDGPAIV